MGDSGHDRLADQSAWHCAEVEYAGTVLRAVDRKAWSQYINVAGQRRRNRRSEQRGRWNIMMLNNQKKRRPKTVDAMTDHV